MLTAQSIVIKKAGLKAIIRDKNRFEFECRYKIVYLIDYKIINSLIDMLKKLDLEPTVDENAASVSYGLYGNINL